MKRIGIIIATFTLVLVLSSQNISAQTTEFTYQGSLKISGTAATGNYDFDFTLFDDLTTGDQVGPNLVRANVTVTNGIFSVSLDFGNQFPGANRFLEIRVRPSGGGEYTALTPRQLISSSPYSIQSLNAENAINAINATTATNALQLGGVDANQFVLTGDVRLSDERNPLPNSPNYIQNSTNQQTTSNFNISGTGTANIINAATQFNLGGDRLISAPGASNTFVGFGTGTNNANGSNNSFFGSVAGQLNTSGADNSFFGKSSGHNNTTGFNNSFFSSNSGFSNTIGNDNSFFGYESGFSNRTGSGNSFFGSRAGLFNMTGHLNSIFGHNAGFGNLTGNENAFFGNQAGQKASGSFNSFFGSQAGRETTTGVSNAFFGRQAGVANTTGSFNTFFGASAGFANETGVRNAFFGTDAGLANTTGDDNAFFGVSAGNTNTTGSNNTVIGRNSDVSVGDLNFATAVGASAVVSTSNTIQLGRANGTDTVNVSGKFRIGSLGSGGETAICRNASLELSTCSSSMRYKTNVNSFSSGINLIRRLRPVSFDWKADGMSDLGLVAEEVAGVEPLLVTRNEKGEVEGIKYDRVGVVLVNAVQEQQIQIESLEKIIDEQGKTIDEQIKTIKRQQNLMDKQLSEFESLKKLVCLQNPTAQICQTNN